MPVEITARHMEATRWIHDYVADKAAELIESFPRIEHVHIILDKQKLSSVCEIVVQAKSHAGLEVRDEAENLRLAIDNAMDKIEKRLRKISQKVRDHKPAMKRAARSQTERS